jgi:hypothetical protein
LTGVDVETKSDKARRVGPSRRIVAVGVVVALVGLLAVSSVAAYVLLNWPDPKVPTRDLIIRMAARDGTASALIDTDASLRTLAEKMGIVNLPGSAGLSVENLQVTMPSAGPSGLTIPRGDWLVAATYTLKWSGKGSSGRVDQRLTAVAQTGTDGKIRLFEIDIAPPLVFDTAAYFGKAGAGQTDADLVAEDLRAGSRWLPGVNVDVIPTVDTIPAPSVYGTVPGHLTTWTGTVAAGVPGSKTIWNVRVTDGTVTYADIAPASLVTAEPVAARVDIGTITPAQADGGAVAAAKAFWSAVDAGDISKVNSLVFAGPKLDAAALGLMKGWGAGNGGLGGATPAGNVTDGPSGPQDKVGAYVYVLGPDGRWGIDTSRSRLIQSYVSGKRGNYSFSVKNGQSGTAACSTRITIKVSRVTFFTDGLAPEAIFSIGSTDKCNVGDRIVGATAGWKGNSRGIGVGVEQPGSEPGAIVSRAIVLPGALKPGMTPIWIKITKYGSPATGAYLPYAMQFSTY